MRQNKQATEATLPFALLRGFLVGAALIFILFAVASLLVSLGKIPEELMPHITCAAAFFGALTGGAIAARSFPHRRFLVAVVPGIIMFALCFAAAALSDSNKFPHRWHLILLAVFFAGGALGGIIAANSRKRRH